MLWGRDRETAAIDRVLEAARAGHGGGLLLRGEPGAGKTALLAAAAERAHGMIVLTADGAEAETALPYAWLHQLLRRVLHRLHRLPEPQVLALGVALGLQAGAAPDRFMVSLAVLTLLSEVAGERPLLCLLDDVQWVDRPSLDVVRFVARRIQSDPVALIAAVRAGEDTLLDAAGIDVLTVGGLDPAAADALLDERWGEQLGPTVRQALVRATAGNPLALVELPAGLTPGQLAAREALPDPLPLAGDLERMFLDRARRLPPAQRTLLLLCAAEGSGSLATIARAADDLGIGASSVQLAGDLLRVEGSTVVFRHPLVRSAVYHGAAPAGRRAAHLALAAASEGRDDEADRRAWHLAQAAQGPDEEVAAELERSADRALRRSGHAAAALALERAAELSQSAEHRSRRLVAAAGAAWHGGDTPRSGALVDQAERLAPADPVVRLEARYLRGVMETRSGVPADGLAILLAAAQEALPVAPHLALRALGAAGEAAFQADDQTAAREIDRLTASLPESGDAGDALLARLQLAVNPMTWGEGPSQVHEDLARVEELDDPELLSRAGGMAFGLGEYAVARRLQTRAVARARTSGAAGTLAWALRALAGDDMARSRFRWAEAAAAEGRRLALETGQTNLACQHQVFLLEVAALRGEEEEARRLAGQVLAEAAGRGLHGTIALTRRALAGLALATGRAEEAVEHLEALWSGPTSQRGVAFASIPDLIEAAVRAGRPQLGRERLRPYLAWAESAGSAEAGALAARAQALLATGAEADRLFEAALRAHAETDRLLDRARTQLLYGEHLRRERHRVDARDALRAALETFETLGAAAWAERARAELRATGETARRRDPSTLDQLTQQELQVVRIVSQGATNREAAAQLFISPRTVDHHLRSVFRKLGIRSRAELVRVAVAGDAGLAVPR
ncbi:MAG TPA: AAA family ATPase [Candidatus Dormibacteraeota bacterium]|nr:AAA family ATPase [Candidatus Dormibacteraeota bacterium]